MKTEQIKKYLESLDLYPDDYVMGKDDGKGITALKLIDICESVIDKHIETNKQNKSKSI